MRKPPSERGATQTPSAQETSLWKPHVFASINRLVQGRGAIATLGDEVARFNASRVLIVTDPGLVRPASPSGSSRR